MTPHDVLKNPRLAILALLTLRGISCEQLGDQDHEESIMTTIWLDYIELRRRHHTKLGCSQHALRCAYHELRDRYGSNTTPSTLSKFMR